MERKLYIVTNYYTGMEKLVKLTDEQANAIEWLFNAFEDEDYGIEEAGKNEDIAEP